MLKMSGLYLALMLFLAIPVASAQETLNTLVRDPQAVALVQKAIAAMGPLPSDSSATGTVQVVEGTTSETGTVQILTLGTTATSEAISFPAEQRTIVYSNRDAKETFGNESANPPVETILTDQCPDFPLPLLSALFSTTDVAMHYVGPETVNGTSVQHVQIWNTFASKPRILQRLASFSMRDFWFDSSSGLPVKVAYERRSGGGAVAAIPVEIYLSRYKATGGVAYPFEIKKSYDGTPWQTITIQNVSFNVGLTADQFQTE